MQMIIKHEGLAYSIANSLNKALAKHHNVVWLVPGGSNIPISVLVMEQIDKNLSSKLTILQTDERFVAPNSPDCNWLQLKKAGFKPNNATVYPIITASGVSRDDLVANYIKTIDECFSKTGYIIGQFGMGADGHIAGIKPKSPASTSHDLVAGYKADDYERITITFSAIKRLNELFLLAFGAEKRPVLEGLATSKAQLEAFPALVVKEVKKAVVYNDQVEL